MHKYKAGDVVLVDVVKAGISDSNEEHRLEEFEIDSCIPSDICVLYSLKGDWWCDEQHIVGFPRELPRRPENFLTPSVNLDGRMIQLAEQEQPTLRDQFAISALGAVLGHYSAGVLQYAEDIAIEAYALADAMMKERKS